MLEVLPAPNGRGYTVMRAGSQLYMRTCLYFFLTPGSEKIVADLPHRGGFLVTAKLTFSKATAGGVWDANRSVKLPKPAPEPVAVP